MLEQALEGFAIRGANVGFAKRIAVAEQRRIDKRRLLEKAENFPKTAPLLIITDGYCDRLLIRREHAFLLPAGSSLPFVAKGEIFRVK